VARVEGRCMTRIQPHLTGAKIVAAVWVLRHGLTVSVPAQGCTVSQWRISYEQPLRRDRYHVTFHGDDHLAQRVAPARAGPRSQDAPLKGETAPCLGQARHDDRSPLHSVPI